jgi:light-regulated signal transduction histidine kinase (bacteriophytochrome)
MGKIPRGVLTPAEWLPGDQDAMHRVRETGTSAVYEKEYVTPDGRRVPVILGVASLGFEPLHGIAIVLDNTERKRVERDLQATNRKLAVANADLSQFAFAASHDLQEPLRQVSTYSQLLVRSADQNVSPDMAMFQRFILQGTTRMRNLLEDLLAYTETSSNVEQPAEPVMLAEALAEALQNLSQVVRETNATIRVVELPAIRGHKTHFVQLFQNLVSNAVKYRSPDRSPEIRISAECEGDEWIFSVVDNGIGIAPEYHKRIFGVFKRLHGKEIPGTGIGLAICQKVVERYGGRIWVESEPGRGSAFRFSLPA